MNKRWYDADPIITNAINLIQNSKDEKKNLMADFIIKEAKNVRLHWMKLKRMKI